MSGAVLVKCSCDHAQQDEMYGKGVRVANICPKEERGSRCTVCSKLHANRYAAVTAKKKK